MVKQHKIPSSRLQHSSQIMAGSPAVTCQKPRFPRWAASTHLCKPMFRCSDRQWTLGLEVHGLATFAKFGKVSRRASARRGRRPPRARSARWPRATVSASASSEPMEHRTSHRASRPAPRKPRGRSSTEHGPRRRTTRRRPSTIAPTGLLDEGVISTATSKIATPALTLNARSCTPMFRGFCGRGGLPQ